jgi:hypothetical protein
VFRHRFDSCGAESASLGAEMGGPSRSVQLILKMSPTVLQQTFTRPLSLESAPVCDRIGREFVQCKTDRLDGGRI